MRPKPFFLFNLSPNKNPTKYFHSISTPVKTDKSTKDSHLFSKVFSLQNNLSPIAQIQQKHTYQRINLHFIFHPNSLFKLKALLMSFKVGENSAKDHQLIQKSENIKRSYILPKTKNKYRNNKKVIHKNNTLRHVIIELAFSVNIPANQRKFGNKAELEQKKLQDQFEFQSCIESSYVVTNLQIIMGPTQIIFVQEDYDCSLADLKISGLTFEQRFSIFRSIAYGVRDLQQINICHLNLAPESIVLKIGSESFTTKINNFSIACKLSSPKSIGLLSSIEITPFTAPELRTQRSFNFKADIFSIGAILNYLLYQTMLNISQVETDTAIEVPKGTPKWLYELLKNMLANKADKRYEINTILDIVKVSTKCFDQISKFIPFGSKCDGFEDGELLFQQL